MTSEKVKLLWIDDDLDHREDVRNLESKNRRLHIRFVIANEFEKILREKADTDLFVIDDKLRLGKYRDGIAVAGQIRVKFPEVPIYLFSAWIGPRSIYGTLAEAAESSADKIVDIKEIRRKGHRILYCDALDYRRIRYSRRGTVHALFELLHAPASDENRITMALPESLKKGLSSLSGKKPASGNAIAFAKWTSRTFLALPGFVFDSLYSATKLGMTQEAFDRHESAFKLARYDGIFAETREALWWGSILVETVFRRAATRFPRDATIDLQQLTPRLLRLGKSEIAKCIICGRERPDTVGMERDDEEHREAVHYRCSIPHPAKRRVICFDEIRQFG